MSRLARDPNFQVHGLVLVFSFDSVKLTDAKFMAGQLRHGRLRLMMHYIRACAPARIGGIFIVKQPKFIGMVWGLVSLFMGRKIRKRVRFLGSNLQVICVAKCSEQQYCGLQVAGILCCHANRLLKPNISDTACYH
jgi:hypothetical protein